jgi:hypothetical protein
LTVLDKVSVTKFRPPLRFEDDRSEFDLSSAQVAAKRNRVRTGKAVELAVEAAVLLDNDDHVMDLACVRVLRRQRNRRRSARAARG